MKMVDDGNKRSVNPGQHQVICAEQEVLHLVLTLCLVLLREGGGGGGVESPVHVIVYYCRVRVNHSQGQPAGEMI